MAQRISIALMTAPVHVIHRQARGQQPVLAVSFRTTIHTASDLYWSTLISRLGQFVGHHEKDSKFVLYHGTIPLHCGCYFNV